MWGVHTAACRRSFSLGCVFTPLALRCCREIPDAATAEDPEVDPLEDPVRGPRVMGTREQSTEAERIRAAYVLGRAVAARGRGDAARYLLYGLDSERWELEAARNVGSGTNTLESTRRAACYGLRAALMTPNPAEEGAVAAPPVERAQRDLAEHVELRQRDLAEHLIERLEGPFQPCGGSIGGTPAVCYALAAAPQPHGKLAAALAATAARTVAELESHKARQPAERLERWRALLEDRGQLEEPLDFAVLDRRLALSECCGALGAVGERTVRQGDAPTTLIVAKALLRLILGEEAGLGKAQSTLGSV